MIFFNSGEWIYVMVSAVLVYFSLKILLTTEMRFLQLHELYIQINLKLNGFPFPLNIL